MDFKNWINFIDEYRLLLASELCFGIVNLEKAFDRFLREVMRWVIRKLGVEEWLVLAVMCCILVQKQL